MSKETIAREEEQKRASVFAKSRKTVLVKILAMGPIHGLERKERDEATIDASHQKDADRRGLEFQAYRPKGDTGYCLFEKEFGVRVAGLIDQLNRLGLRYVGGHWQQREGKGPINILQFSTEGEEVMLPHSVAALLRNRRFNHCTVWCNLRYSDEGKGGQYRLDTINLAKGQITGEPARRLIVTGNTYRLI